MKLIPLAAAAFSFGLILRLLPAPQQDVEIKTTHVAGSVYMLEGQGGNIGVSAGPDGLLMIDDQYANLAPKIREALGKLGQGRLKLLINTHWHGDHTGGNAEFGKEALILAHAKVRERLSKPQSRGGRETPASPLEALPVVTYESGLSIHFNGEEVEVYHLPAGHTDGDSAVYFPRAKVLHLGDQFFSGRFPFIDLDSGGSVAGFLRNLEQVLARVPEDVKIIPGHGPLSARAELQAARDMLAETFAHVSAQAAAGRSLEEVKAAGLPEKWRSWAWQFINEERWIEILYRGATGR